MTKQELLSVPAAKLGLSEVRAARACSFQKQQSGKLTYGIDRGAFGHDPYLNYEPNLPKFYLAKEGKSVDFKTAIADSIRTDGKARVLDIGCGTGRFLRDLRKSFGKNVDLVGISAFDWRNDRQRQKDAKRSINYSIDDAQRLLRCPSSDFDCVISVRAIEYMADPIAVIKGAYRVLKPGAFAFLDMRLLPYHFAEPEDYHRLVSFLSEEYNFQFHIDDVAFRKTKERLILPVKFVDHQVDEKGYSSVIYALNLNSMTSPSCT